jgi:hypothetical protein
MSGTMVYSYVYDMRYTRPQAYVGKTIKARGQYNELYDNRIKKCYHFVIIKDAAECCSQGLEFEYEDDYPEKDKEIEVVGTFEKYYELGVARYYLKVSEIKVI